MLDPLTAISLASAVVQFTDFGIKLVTGSIELYHSADGANAERPNLELKSNRVINLADKIIFPEHNRDDGPESEDDKQLRELAKTSKLIASDLLNVLDELKVKAPASHGRKWESFKKAVTAQTPHNKNKIADLDKRLHSVHQAMLNQIQFMMSEQQSQVLSTLKDLADKKLLELKDEILKGVIKGPNGTIADLSGKLSSLAEASRKQKTLCIINSLDFETRQSRQSDISDPQHRTFEWIFHDHHGPFNQHVGFRNWLQFGNDIYWISGKAGSGKSVLMNYVANEPRTQEMLQS